VAARSLYDVLREDFGRVVAEAQETIEPVILTPAECALLEVPRHTPAILTRRVTTDRTGTIVELSQALLRGDRSRFLLIRRVEEPAAFAAPGSESGAGTTAATLRLDAPTVAGELAPTHRPPRPIPSLSRRTPTP
jgi:GntR family transcriptional regulator